MNGRVSLSVLFVFIFLILGWYNETPHAINPQTLRSLSSTGPKFSIWLLVPENCSNYLVFSIIIVVPDSERTFDLTTLGRS